MESSTILLILLLIILSVILGIILASFLSGRHCTTSYQQLTSDDEANRFQQGSEQKRPGNFVSRLIGVSPSSSKRAQPQPSVPNTRRFDFTINFGNDQKDREQKTMLNEPLTNPSTETPITEVEYEEEQRKQEENQKKREENQKKREERRKRGEELRRKYNIW